MSRIIRAKVESNSCDDEFARVKISCPDVWDKSDNSPLVESVGGIPLKEGDLVFVDISDGYENPLIIGRSTGSMNSYGKEVSGSLLFESSDGSKFSIAFVKNNKMEFYNSDGVSFVTDANSTEINVENLKITTKSGTVTGGEFTMKGSVTPEGSGPFCAVTNCLFTGAPHVGTKVSGT